MARTETMRETITELPTQEEIERKAEQGWEPAAIEWRRVGGGSKAQADRLEARETPYGLCTHTGGTELEANRDEEEALALMLGMFMDEGNSLAKVAEELNRRGYLTRSGTSWSQGQVFKMLPRLVEVAPSLFARADWSGAGAVTTH